jgi:hypothetical protein
MHILPIFHVLPCNSFHSNQKQMKVGSCRQAIFNVHEPNNIISASLLQWGGGGSGDWVEEVKQVC